MKSYLNTFLGQIANRGASELNLAKRAFEAGWMARAVADGIDKVLTPKPVSELTPLVTPEPPVSEPVSEPPVAPAESAAPIEPEQPVEPIAPAAPIEPVQPVQPVVN